MFGMLKNLRTHMKWIMIIIVVTFLLSTFLMYEGRSGRRGPSRSADGTMTDYEVAAVGGRPLMRSELENRLRAYLENSGLRNAASRDMPAVYQAVLDQYVLEQQLENEVRKADIAISDADAEQAMKAYADSAFPTREAFYAALERQGISSAEYKKNLARQLAVQQLLHVAVGDVTVSEDEAVKFYDSIKDQLFRTPAGVNLQVARFGASADAEALRASLQAGTDWAQATSGDALASMDVLSVTREPLFLPESAFTGALAELASLDVGAVSPVFSATSGDFSVAVKTELVSESIRPYEDVSSDVRAFLRSQEERRKLNDYEADLMAKAEVVIYDASLFPASADAVAASPDLQPASMDAAASSDQPASDDAATDAEPQPASDDAAK
mgnify:FL=1